MSAVTVAVMAQGVRVLVPSEDAAAARRLLAEENGPAKPLNAFQRLLVRLLGGRDRG